MVVAKYTSDGLRVTRTISMRVVGITQKKGGESDYAVYMNLDEMTALNQWLTNRRINRDKDGFPQLLVRAADQNDVLEIADTITALGFQASSAQQYIEPLNNFYLVLQVIFGGVGAIALLVAAIGIANTMTMAILERTREIGLMKAVGATNRDVLGIFLGEAAGIGFVGGLGGILLGWIAGYLMNIAAIAYFSNNSGGGFGFSGTSSAVVTPVWLVVGSLVFATFIGLVSGLYPALRAATLVPVIALKTE
jgi:putative ABC transport system permease protein